MPTVPRFPYPPPGPGYWSPVTSTLNWCEEDYYATVYAAEIVNTITNALFLYLGAKGIRSCRKNGHDSVFQGAFLGYLVVGLGSFLFHATLKYPMQLVDELSMIYTTCLMCYATFSFSQSPRVRSALMFGLVGLCIFITLYYHYLQDPTFHQNAYAVLTAVVILRSMWIMEVTLRPSWYREHKEPSPSPKLSPCEKAEDPVAMEVLQKQKEERDMRILKTMWAMVAWGLSTFLGGFAIWNLDNCFCSKLVLWRRAMGLPWGILLEGHGWWHLMTGVGAYMYIVWGIWLRHCLNGRQEEYALHWPHFYSFPDIIRVEKSNPELPEPAVVNPNASGKKAH